MEITLKREYKVIVFDLGNVLIPFDHSLWIKRLNSLKNGLGERFYSKFTEIYSVHREFEKGAMSRKKFIETMLSWTENTLTAEEFCVFYSNIFQVDTQVAGLLPELKHKYKLVLLSNTNEIHREYGWNKFEFLEYFDKLILSYEVGANKPDSEIYKAVEEYTEESPETHIFIDDIPEYADRAKELGWDGILFRGYKNLVEELNSRKIL